LRDLIFLGLTCAYLLVILLWIGKINLLVNFGLIMLYIIYVVTVLLQNKYFSKEDLQV
jgi:hypothetical protein